MSLPMTKSERLLGPLTEWLSDNGFVSQWLGIYCAPESKQDKLCIGLYRRFGLTSLEGATFDDRMGYAFDVMSKRMRESYWSGVETLVLDGLLTTEQANVYAKYFGHACSEVARLEKA